MVGSGPCSSIPFTAERVPRDSFTGEQPGTSLLDSMPMLRSCELYFKDLKGTDRECGNAGYSAVCWR